MLDLQDQKIMHDYFSDLLFKPIIEELEKIETLDEPVSKVEVVEEQTATKEIELLPLPANREQRTEKYRKGEENKLNEPVTENINRSNISEDLKQENKNPWGDYQWENDRPPWAQQQFDCLLFEVCGFHFAVPLITLGQIQAITEDLTPVFGQAQWFMGIQNTPMGKQRVVNTALFVMPERYQPTQDYNPPYMISIADCPWALAVDKVNQPISLMPDAVKWRVHREKQTWLAGVVKKQMCVLIDVPELAKQLLNGDKNIKS